MSASSDHGQLVRTQVLAESPGTPRTGALLIRLPGGGTPEVQCLDATAELLLGDGAGSTAGRGRPIGLTELLAHCPDVAESGRITSIEVDWVAVPGVDRVRCTLLPAEDGVVALLEDVTERQRERDALSLAELRLAQVDQWARVGFWEVDLRTDEIYLSTQAFQILGLGSPSLAAFMAGVHADDRLVVEHVTDRARVQPGPYRLVHRTAGEADVRTLQHNMQSVVGDDGRPGRLLGFVTDVTAEHALDEHMRRAVAQQSVGLAAGGIVHDLNNAFAVINGHVQLAVQALRRDASVDIVHLEAIGRAADSARALTRALLAAGREEPLVPRRFRPSDVLAGVRGAAEATLGGQRTVDVHTDGADIDLIADPGRLERTLIDLVVNADDALPPDGGRVEITCGRVVLDDQHPRVVDGSLAPGVYGQITVVDDGCGMDDGVLERVVEPFFSTKPPEQGSGIGLASADTFARRTGGALSITSALGQGTTVSLLLPAIDRAPDRPRTSREPARRILVVVPDERARALSTAFSSAGYQVVEASGVADAERVLSTEPIDAVVADETTAPRLQGADLRQTARASGLVVLAPQTGGRTGVATAIEQLLPQVSA